MGCAEIGLKSDDSGRKEAASPQEEEPNKNNKDKDKGSKIDSNEDTDSREDTDTSSYDSKDATSCPSGGNGGPIGKGKKFSHSIDTQVWLPKNYDKDKAYPLVFSFHGMASNRAYQMTNYPFNNYVDQKDFILAVTNGGSYQFEWAYKANNATKELEKLLKKLFNSYNIDKQRVYMFGHSAGGFHAFNFACNYDYIAGASADGGAWFGGTANEPCENKELSLVVGFGARDHARSQIDNMWNFMKKDRSCEGTGKKGERTIKNRKVTFEEHENCGGEDRIAYLWLDKAADHFSNKSHLLGPLLDTWFEKSKRSSCE